MPPTDDIDSTSADARRQAALDERLRRLPQALEPPEDLWPAVAAELEPPARWRVPLAMAAAAVLAVGLTAYQWQASAPVPAAAAEVALIDIAGPEFVALRGPVRARLMEEIDALDPASRDAVVSALQKLLSAREELERALADTPDNTLLRRLWLSTARRELALLNDLEAMNQRRTLL